MFWEPWKRGCVCAVAYCQTAHAPNKHEPVRRMRPYLKSPGNLSQTLLLMEHATPYLSSTGSVSFV